MCVHIYHPTLRFFARNDGAADGRLRVDVLFELQGQQRALTVGSVQAGGAWRPSPILPVVANLLSLLTNETTDVAFRFTARGGSWQVDGVYVDPWGKN